MKKNEADELFNEDKITKETESFLNKRKMNDLIDGRLSYQDNPENFKMISEDAGKMKKNVFVHKGEGGVSFKVFKDKHTEEPVEDGDIYGPINYKSCNTADKMLGQIRYLVGFDWCTAEIIDQFILMVESFHIGHTGELLFKGEGR
tara:strand:+ start:42 stop:479 length:438 start_codon:yes stop_codon:yes gene_type:complete